MRHYHYCTYPGSNGFHSYAIDGRCNYCGQPDPDYPAVQASLARAAAAVGLKQEQKELEQDRFSDLEMD